MMYIPYIWFLIVLLQDGCEFSLGDQCSCPVPLDTHTAGFEDRWGKNTGADDVQFTNRLAVTDRYSSVSYTKLDDDVNVVNPFRGLYYMISVRTSDFTKLESRSLQSIYNIVLRLYYLDTYVNRDLDSSFVSKVKADLATIRSNGWTVLLRFAYTEDYDHQDASLSQMKQHIRYLDSHNVFRDYGSVIAAIQAGFIGVWGEWHYTNDDFGKPGSCSSTFGLSSSQWDARKQVLQALLDASPKSVDIQVRIPAFKYHIWDHTVTTLDSDRHETDASRIGYHNDAFLSGEHNEGTFVCDGDKTFMADDSRYTVVAGETNNNHTPSDYTCSKAKSELAKYHYSILHASYEPIVIASWKSHGCFDEIASKLGYRLYLTKAILPDSVESGGKFCYKITLHNNGYAAPYKALEARIVLQNTGSQYSIKIPNVDARTWQPNTDFQLSGSTAVPTNLHGSFKVYLVVAHAEMPTNSKYYILLANRHGVQQTSSRMNDLLHTVAIAPGSCHGSSTGSGTSSSSCHSLKLSDGSFENKAHGWEKYSHGFTVVTDTSAIDGHAVVRVTNGGAKQTIDFSSSPVQDFTISGYSRHSSGAGVSDSTDYSIYCDLVHTNGDETYGKTSNFAAASTHHNVWVFRELHVHASKPIREASCYAMFRNGHGHADFDHFRINSCPDPQCEYQTLDGSFEVGDGWTIYNAGFSRTNNHALAENGNSFITVTNGGAQQFIDFNSGTVTRFTLSGYSKAHSVTGISDGSDYSIYCDLTHPDHTNTWGEHASFDPNKSTWQKVVLKVVSSKVISGARCYAMFRNGHGRADFDNFKLEYCA